MTRERVRALFPFAALAAVATLLTAWLLASARIPRSADQAVVALMARHILEGRGHPVFYWGSTYGGTLEPHLLVPVFAAFGVTPAAFRAFYVALWAAFLGGTAAFTGRFFGRVPALLAAAFLAVPPFFLPYKMLTSDGAYASVALFGLAALWCACEADARLESGESALGLIAALGLVAGIGLWVTPVTLPVPALAALWLIIRPGHRPRAAVLAAGTVAGALGAMPSIVWNLRHAGTSLTAPELAPAVGAGFFANAKGLVSAALPVLFGAARPHFSGGTGLSFPGAPAVVPVLVLCLLVPAFAAALRGDRRLRLLVAVAGALVAAAVLARRLDPTEPRYLVAVYAALAPLLGVSLARALSLGRAARLAAGGAFVIFLASNLSGSVHAHRHLVDTGDAQVTGTLEPLLARLRELGVTRVFTNYWAAYRISFESGGTILAAPVALEDADRIASIQEAARAAAAPAVVLLPPRDACFRLALEETGEPFREHRSGAFVIFERLPAAVRDAVRGGGLPMPAAGYRVAWSAADVPSRLAAGSAAAGRVRATNEGPCTWTGGVRLVAAWSGPESLEAAVSSPGRPVGPGETVELRVPLLAPRTPGSYGLQLDLEQAGVTRFSARGAATFETRVTVEP